MTRKSGADRGEPQMNVPISASYHEQLQAIAFADKKSMKAVVERMIESDGRGKALVEAIQSAGKTLSPEPQTTAGTEGALHETSQ